MLTGQEYAENGPGNAADYIGSEPSMQGEDSGMVRRGGLQRKKGAVSLTRSLSAIVVLLFTVS